MTLLAVLGASVVAFALLETFFGHRERADRKHLRLDLAYLVSDFLGNCAVNFVRPIFPAAIGWVLGRAWDGPLAATHWGVQFFVGTLVLEFGIWFAHWCWHRFDVLYPFHAVHHASTRVYFLSGLRQHPVQFLGDQLFFAALLTLVGISPPMIASLAVVQMVLAFFTHSNLNVRFRGPLRYIVATPRFHVLHHDATGKGDSKNLGGGLSVFDWIFGTALDAEKEPHPEALGSAQAPPTYAAQLVKPFRDVLERGS